MDYNFLSKALELVDSKKPVPNTGIVFTNDKFEPIKKISGNALTYQHRYRGQWFRPEYDFDQIQIAEGADSYFTRAIQRKVNKLISAGYDFTGNTEEPVKYIKRRIREMEFATQRPFITIVALTVKDLSRFNNCIWSKVRNKEVSSGEIRYDYNGKAIDPVAGYFVLPMETLLFKQKLNGDIKKVMQRMKDGTEREFPPRDIIHFYTNKNAGFSVGSPELWPALDDIQLLRRIEENVEELVDTNLFPVFQWKVGTDAMPEKMSPRGEKETDIVRNTVQYTPASGMYVTDHRHEISAIGSEGRALRIDYYLNYFKNRVFTALGTSSVDMGEGDSSNRSTASTMSKGMIMDLEAMAVQLEQFVNFYVINELLIEGGFDPLEEEDQVYFKFGVIDKEERRAQENHLIQSFHGQVRTMDETRKGLGEKPWNEEDMERSYFKMFEEPNALLKGMGAGTAASETLAALPASNITPAAVAKETAFAKQMEKQKKAGQAGAKPKAAGSGSRSASAGRSRPSNQHGTRNTTKTNRDLTESYEIVLNDVVSIHVDKEYNVVDIENWKKTVFNRAKLLDGVDLTDLAENMLWRLTGNE